MEATREIRIHFLDLPLIFISAWDEPEMKRAAFDVGTAEYRVAPFEFDQLIDAVFPSAPPGSGRLNSLLKPITNSMIDFGSLS